MNAYGTVSRRIHTSLQTRYSVTVLSKVFRVSARDQAIRVNLQAWPRLSDLS